MAKKQQAQDILLAGGSSDNELDYSGSEDNAPAKISAADDFSADDFNSDDEEVVFQTKKKVHTNQFGENDEDLASEAEEAESESPAPAGKLDETSAMVEEERKRSTKLKRLTPEQLAKEQKKIKKTGVCYLSSIPPYMKPVKLRSVLGRYGKLDRIFLKPEDPREYQKRVKYGGNKKKKYTEGWVEFVKKKEAKLCAETMNGNILGGKKSSYYHDDIINIKYLPGFKWFDLTQQIAKENEVRQAKLSLEISQQAKLNKSFVNNVERSKHLNRKRKAGTLDAEPEAKRKFDQRDVASTRADAKLVHKKEAASNDLSDVLSKVF